MPKTKKRLTAPPNVLTPRKNYVLHPMQVPKDADGYGGRTYVWVLSTLSPEMYHGALVDCYDSSRANAVAQASALLGRCAVMGQRSELRVRKLDGQFGESRTFPRSSDPRRSKG